MSILIKKADGTTEFFKVEKLRRSLRRAGASSEEITKIVSEIDKTLYEGVQTQEIYRQAFSLLHKGRSPAAARYSLRRALFSLGPTGFPFEKFLARLFQQGGYSTKTGVTLSGKCADHEIDVVAYKDDHSFIGEAKFHSRPGVKSDLQVAMYTYARFLDLKGNRICKEDVCVINEFWLITNTKFTTSALKYGNCVGLKMLSWNFPKANNLHDRIQKAGVYPITVLQNLTSSQAETLIARDVILCRDILDHEEILKYLHLPKHKYTDLMAEVRILCRGK